MGARDWSGMKAPCARWKIRANPYFEKKHHLHKQDGCSQVPSHLLSTDLSTQLSWFPYWHVLSSCSPRMPKFPNQLFSCVKEMDLTQKGWLDPENQSCSPLFLNSSRGEQVICCQIFIDRNMRALFLLGGFCLGLQSCLVCWTLHPSGNNHGLDPGQEQEKPRTRIAHPRFSSREQSTPCFRSSLNAASHYLAQKVLRFTSALLFTAPSLQNSMHMTIWYFTLH